MRNNNRKCYSCNTEYYYCFSCPDTKEPAWHHMFCSEDCKDIFNALTDYNYEHIDADKTFDLIKNKMTKDTKMYSDGIQKIYKKLLKEKSKKVEVVSEPVRTKKQHKNYIFEDETSNS